MPDFLTFFDIRFTGFKKTAGEYVLEFQVSVIMQEVKNGKQVWLPGCDLKRRNAYASMPELQV